MKRQLLLALLAAGLAAAPGCADKRDAVPGIRITPSIKTRVTGLHFDTGDCIGLTVTKNGSDYVRNHQMTYDGSAFTASGLLWYNDLNETSTLTAYFPYSASGVPDEFSVARDQSAGCASLGPAGGRGEERDAHGRARRDAVLSPDVTADHRHYQQFRCCGFGRRRGRIRPDGLGGSLRADGFGESRRGGR